MWLGLPGSLGACRRHENRTNLKMADAAVMSSKAPEDSHSYRMHYRGTFPNLLSRHLAFQDPALWLKRPASARPAPFSIKSDMGEMGIKAPTPWGQGLAPF